jgi:hypothetical protein
MKKTTYNILFGLSAAAVLMGAIMKLYHIEGAGILLGSGFIVGTIISPLYSLSQSRYIRNLEAQTGDNGEGSKSMRKLVINILFILSSVTVLAGAYMVIMKFSGGFIVLIIGFTVGTLISTIDNLQKKQDIEELEAQLREK